MSRVKEIARSADFFLSGLTIVLIAFSVLIVFLGSRKTESRSENRYQAAADSSPKPVEIEEPCSEPEYPFSGKVKGAGVRFREEPSTQTGRIIRELSESVRVEVLDKEGSWYFVKIRDEEGYIFEDYISPLTDH